MKHKLLLLYAWLVRSVLYFLPDVPIIMRFRGFLYSLGMKKAGKNFQVAHNVILNTIEGLTVGNNVYIAYNNVWIIADVTIGDNVMFGPQCLLVSDNHTFSNGGGYRYGDILVKPIIIGSYSWIGGQCSVLCGSVFPDSSVLAANSTLTSKCQFTEQGIYGGSPAKLIKSTSYQ